MLEEKSKQTKGITMDIDEIFSSETEETFLMKKFRMSLWNYLRKQRERESQEQSKGRNE